MLGSSQFGLGEGDEGGARVARTSRLKSALFARGLSKPVGRKGESSKAKEGMAARFEEGILHAFRPEFPLPKARCAYLECRLSFPKPPEGLELKEAQVERGRIGSRFPVARLAAAIGALAAEEWGQRGVLKAQVFQSGEPLSKPQSAPSAFSSLVDVSFPSDLKLASYPGVAA